MKVPSGSGVYNLSLESTFRGVFILPGGMPNFTGITKEGREGFRFQWIFPAPYQTSKRFKQARAFLLCEK